MKIVGLLLAGGQSRRMGGGDKALRLIGGVPLLERVIERMRPQVETLVLNANGDPARFASFGLPVVPDSVPDYAGPLAGVLAGLDWTAEHRPDCCLRRQRRNRCAVPAERPRVAARARHGKIWRGPRLRSVRRSAASGDRPLAGAAARRPAPRGRRTRRSARSMCGRRATASRPCPSRASR